MATNPLFLRLAEMRRSLMNEGIINPSFLRLELYKGRISSDKDLLADTVESYFQTSLEMINTMENELAKPEPDFSMILLAIYEFEKSTKCTVGAPKLTAAIAVMQACLLRERERQRGNLESCKTALQNVKEKQGHIQTKLTEYLNIRRQTRPEVITHQYECSDTDDERDHSDCNHCSCASPYFECDAYPGEGNNDHCECSNDHCECGNDHHD